MSKNNMDFVKKREKYWNKDYMHYWSNRVSEANQVNSESSTIIKGDPNTTTDKTYINAIKLLNIVETDEVVEIGCGFGRSLPALCKASHHVTALDISSAMIDVAKNRIKEKNVSFLVSSSENTPLDSNKYDVVVCFASFDAMYQTKALIEMNRICKKGARILITGKNDNYIDNDNLAIDAEVGARKKGHPNYFTDLGKLLKNIDKFGFSINLQYYYPRRGDFSSFKSEIKMPKMFYEYLLVLCKTSDSIISDNFVISDTISKTFKRIT